MWQPLVHWPQRFGAAVVVCLTLLGPAEAQPVDDVTAALINAGDFGAARDVLAQNPHSKSDALLLEGRIAKAQGNISEAVALLRDALRADPESLPVRRELAHTLYLDKQYRAARYHLRWLRGADPDPRFQAGYLDLETRIDRENPLQLSFYFALSPTTNVNGGTGNRIVETSLGELKIDEESRAKSGVGITAGGRAAYNWVLPHNGFVTADLRLSHTEYPDNSSFNRTRGRFAVDFGQRRANTAWTLTPFLSREWRNDDNDYRGQGLQYSLDQRLSARTSLHLGVSHEDRNYAQLDGKDGDYQKLGFSVRHFFTPAVMLEGGLGLERSDVNTSHLSYDGASAFVQLRRSWRGGLISGVTFFSGKRDFDDQFPLTDYKRSDEYHGIAIDLHFTQVEWGGFTPRLTCRGERYNSNVALYDSETIGCSANFSRRF